MYQVIGDLGMGPWICQIHQELPHRHKLVICGNMDQRLESQANKAARAKFLPAATWLQGERDRGAPGAEQLVEPLITRPPFWLYSWIHLFGARRKLLQL